MNHTSLEQSKKLTELGLPTNTSDLWLTEFQPLKQEGWKLVPDGEKFVTVNSYKPTEAALADYKFTPCWSVAALTNVMAKRVRRQDGTRPFVIEISRGMYRFSGFYDIDHKTPFYDELIDAAFDMACWLLKNGFITKEE